MDQKTIISNVLTALLTTAILALVGYFGGIFEKGQAAIDKEQIRLVLQEELKTDAGETYGAALTKIGLDVNTVSTQVGTLTKEVDNLEVAVLALASE